MDSILFLFFFPTPDWLYSFKKCQFLHSNVSFITHSKIANRCSHTKLHQVCGFFFPLSMNTGFFFFTFFPFSFQNFECTFFTIEAERSETKRVHLNTIQILSLPSQLKIRYWFLFSKCAYLFFHKKTLIKMYSGTIKKKSNVEYFTKPFLNLFRIFPNNPKREPIPWS